jgi:hypothetical protein
MDRTDAFAVTLEAELYQRLDAEARRLGVALEWVVASLIVDTIEADAPEPALL